VNGEDVSERNISVIGKKIIIFYAFEGCWAE
jgi:hypothetical protein